MAVNMDHAQLRFPDPTAALQLSSAMHRYRLPGGLLARLFQNLAARNSHTCCNGLRPNSAKRISVEVLPLTPVISLSMRRWLVTRSFLKNAIYPRAV